VRNRNRNPALPLLRRIVDLLERPELRLALRASTFVIAAVVVVFPWSTWPIVPTFTCGFVRSNFAFAIADDPPWKALLV